MFFSETTGPIGIKIGHNSPWVVPFRNCVQQVRVQSKMAASGKHSLRLDTIGKCIQRYFPLKLLGQLEPNLVTMVFGLTKLCLVGPGLIQDSCHQVTSSLTLDPERNTFKIFSKTTGPFRTKLDYKCHWMIPFKILFRRSVSNPKMGSSGKHTVT